VVAASIWYIARPELTEDQKNGKTIVAAMTTDFGASMKMVSILTDKPSVLAEEMDKYYRPYVSQELLEEWRADSRIALGRQTSSPYPAGIDIQSVTKINSTTIKVTGTVNEVANNAEGIVETVSTYPVTLTYEYLDDTWKMTEAEKGSPTE
jgi:ABC-type Fe2+-enterobactin transport system substrate-binding protein